MQKRLIAKTMTGAEYLHSKSDSYFVTRSAERILEILNDAGYHLKPGETWHLYDYDFYQDTYCTKRLTYSHGNVYSHSI